MVNEVRPQQSRRRWRRRAVFAALAALIATVLMLITLPLWLPWVALPLLRGSGVAVRDWERHGTARLELRGVGFSNEVMQLDVARVEIQWPHRWLFDRLGSADTGAPQATASGWTLRLGHTRGEARDEASDGSLSAALDEAITWEDRLRPWLRRIEATQGRLEWSGRALEIPDAELTTNGLSVEFTARDPLLAGTLTLAVRPVAQLHLAIAEQQHSVALESVWSRATDAWTVDGDARWRGQRARLDGRLAAEGWLPQTLSLSATNWILPAAMTPWPAGGDWTGGFAAGWTNGHYVFAARAGAQPDEAMPLARERIEVDFAGSGTLEALLLERLAIATPALNATLTQPLALTFDGRLLVPEAVLTVDARITEREQLPFTATLDGTVRVRPAPDETVQADFALKAEELSTGGFTVRDAVFEGALRWPALTLSNATFELPDAGRLRFRGNVDLVSRALSAIEWSFAGRVPPSLLGEMGSANDVSASGTLSGVWPALAHHTELRAGAARWRAFAADSITGSAEGVLTGTNAMNFRLRAGESELAVAGAVDFNAWSQSQVAARLESLSLTVGERSPATLAKPVDARLHWPAPTNAAAGPRFDLAVTPFDLRRGDGRIELSGSVAWPVRGEVSLAAANVTTDDIAPFWPGQITEARLREWTLHAAWDNGPLQATSRLAAAWSPEPGMELSIEADAQAGADGLRFHPVTLREGTRDVLSLTGTLPIGIHPAESQPVVWRDGARFEARLATLSSEFLDREFARWTGWEMNSASVTLSASGDPAAPVADMEFSAASLRVAGFTNLPPELTTVSNLAFQAGASRAGLALKRGAFEVAGRPVLVSGTLPVDAKDWEGWMRQLREPDWRRIEGALDVDGFPMAALASRLGEVIAPVGEATLRVRLKTGGLLGGELSLTNVATRTFEPVGGLRELTGVVDLLGTRATVRQLSALLGGQRVHVSGGLGWDEMGVADMALSLRATNVALVRSADFFLRSDLDVRLVATNHAPPVLAGDVRLRESLLFQDLAALTSIDLNKPELRPPYFSVTTPPLDRWRLDLRVTGQRFLKVISPVFRGDLTAGLRLGGSLREPVAVGEVTVENGRMAFPFGGLELGGGAVRFTQTDPHRPQLDFHAEGRNFGYQIQAHLTGTADAPNLTFTSVPPLTTRQILLMLSTGEIPSGAFEFSDADKASRLGFYLGKQLMNELLGRDDSEERLTVRTGEHVTSDGRLTYNLEYQLTEKFSLFGEYSRFRDYNGGLKFKVYSR